MTVRLLCLDADGTVFNTMPLLERLAVRLLRTYGISDSEARQLYVGTSGLPFRAQLELMFPENARNWRVAYVFEKSKPTVVLRERTVFDDAAQLLERCRTVLGVRVALVSSTREGVLEAMISRNGLRDEIFVSRGIECGDKAEQIVQVSDRCLSKEVLFVGDSPYDAMFATRAGVPFVGLARDGRLVTQFQTHTSNLIFNLLQLERFM